MRNQKRQSMYRKSDEAAQLIRDLMEAGFSDEEIGRELGYTPKTVLNYRHRFGLRRGNFFTEAERYKMVSLFQEGFSIADIAKQFKCHRNTVLYWIKRGQADESHV